MNIAFSKKVLLTGLGAAALLAGCVNVDKETAQTPREYWKPSKNAQPKDPLAIQLPPAASPVSQALAKSDPLSLPTLTDMALDNNPQTRQSWFAAKSAAAQYGESQSAYYPTVTGNATISRGRNAGFNYTNPPSLQTYTATSTAPGVTINWLLYDFGKRTSDVGRAREALYAANFNYNQAVQDTVLNVQTAYYNFNAAIGLLEAAQANLADAKANYDAAKAKLDSGLGNSQDALQAYAQMMRAEYQIEGAKADIEASRAQLAAVLGVPVSSRLDIVTIEEIPTEGYLEKQVGDLMAQALRDRPMLLAQYANLRQSEYAAASASADRWPQIVAFGQYAYNNIRWSGDDYSYNGWAAGVGLQWELFTGFQKTYALISAHEQEKAARQAMRSAELEIVSQVWQYYYAFRAALRQVESAKAQVKAQSEAYQAISDGYRSGLNSFLDVLTASNDLASARQLYVEAVGKLGTSIAQLAHATGAVALTTPDSQLNAYRENKAAPAQKTPAPAPAPTKVPAAQTATTSGK